MARARLAATSGQQSQPTRHNIAEPPPSCGSSAGALNDSSAPSLPPRLPPSERGSSAPPSRPHGSSADADAAAYAAAAKEALLRGAASGVSTSQARCEAAEAAYREARREADEAKDYEREIIDSAGRDAGASGELPRASAPAPAGTEPLDDAAADAAARSAHQAEADARASVSKALRVIIASAPGPVRALADKVASATLHMTAFDVFAATTAVGYIVAEWQTYISKGSPFDGFDEVADSALFAYEEGQFVSFQVAFKAMVERALSRGRRVSVPASMLSSSYHTEPLELPSRGSPSAGAAAAVELELARRMEAAQAARDASAAAAANLEAERALRVSLESRLSALESGGPPRPSGSGPYGPPATPGGPPPPPYTPSPMGVPPSPSMTEALALMPMPPVPSWYNIHLSAGLTLPNGFEQGPKFELLWAQGPQCREDLRTSPFTAETLCRRIQHLQKDQYAWYGNLRGVWHRDAGTQWVWYIKGSRTVEAADSLLATMLSAALQQHAAMRSESHRIVKIEISNSLTPADRVSNLFWEADKTFVPRKRAAMLLVLQSFRWEDLQSAETLWHAMDSARVLHGESPQALCEQYLSNINAVVAAEVAGGFGPGNPSERWTLAVNILSLVEDSLSSASPDDGLLEEVRLILDKDRKDAKTPLPAPPRGRGAKEPRVFNADPIHNSQPTAPLDPAEESARMLAAIKLQQDHQSEVLAAFMKGGGGGSGGARRWRHLGVPGCADLPYIISTGKIWPASWLPFEFNPARADGRVDHKLCPGCPKHVPPITITYEYGEAKELNGGMPPTRRAEGNPGPRTLQQHEALWHPIGKCYDVWDDIWQFVHEHPDDPDAERFKTPLTDREFQDRLKAHRRSRDGDTGA